MEKIHHKEQNFFMYLSTNAPHDPSDDVLKDLYEEYKEINLNNDQFPENKGHKLPDYVDSDTRARIFSMIRTNLYLREFN